MQFISFNTKSDAFSSYSPKCIRLIHPSCTLPLGHSKISAPLPDLNMCSHHPQPWWPNKGLMQLTKYKLRVPDMQAVHPIEHRHHLTCPSLVGIQTPRQLNIIHCPNQARVGLGTLLGQARVQLLKQSRSFKFSYYKNPLNYTRSLKIVHTNRQINEYKFFWGNHT